MPITKIDDHSALIIVDLQKGIAAFPVLKPLEEIVDNVNRLSAAFRQRDLPVVFVVAEGSSPGRTDMPIRHMKRSGDFAELLEDLSVEPGDYRISKNARGAFTGTDLEAILSKHGVTQVAVTGVATSNGVESTARQAFELGMNVVLPLDAMTDANPEAESYSVSRVFPRMAETGDTARIIELIGR